MNKEQLDVITGSLLGDGYATKKHVFRVKQKLDNLEYVQYLNNLFKDQIKPGPIIDDKGNVLGEHKGIPFYTVGQREGLGIAYKHALYVIRIDRNKNTIVVGGYPLDMRYAGPREALLHALFRQNYGCSHLIVGRDHAGVGEYYGPFDAHKIFDEIPKDALETKPLKIDWTFWCNKCDGMASMKTCPHGKEDRLILSGTKLRKMLSEGEPVTDKFSRPEVLDILRKYYEGLTEKVEIKTHKYAEGV